MNFFRNSVTLLNDSSASFVLDPCLFSVTLSEGTNGFVISSMPYTSPVIADVRKYVFIENLKLHVCPGRLIRRNDFSKYFYCKVL